MNKKFGVMLDMSRNAVMKVEEVKNFVSVIKSFGYNMIQLYTEDTYEVDNEPYFGYFRGRYTKNELTDIVNYCNSIGVDAIPCIQTLAHLNCIFRWKEYTEICDTNDILLCENPKTYELIENMISTLRKSFTSKYLHIGMDEAHMLGLGKYLDENGYKNRFEILQTHLKKVIEIAKKYDFTPIMWSDMFFRLGNNGEYYPENPKIPQSVVDKTPEDVILTYWDYYHDDKKTYDKMIKAHKKFKNEIWFAGGAWTWTGFTPNNAFSLKTMLPAMISAKENNIENIFITMWGDNGKECSFYSALPVLYAIKRFYDGETDMNKIKSEFFSLTSENFDAMMDLELPNLVGNNSGNFANPSKYMFYADPFLGAIDSLTRDNINSEYIQISKKLYDYSLKSKNYAYIFESQSALSEVLSIKYGLGYSLRKAYQENDKAELKRLNDTIPLILNKIDKFYNKFSYLWMKENKPHGFDVQDIRIGGLKQRLISCHKRMEDYLNGKTENIAELDEKLLNWYSGREFINKDEPTVMNSWQGNVTVNNL